MVDVGQSGAEAVRGKSSSHMRAFTCKDCRREVESLERRLRQLKGSGAGEKKIAKTAADLEESRQKAIYNENWAINLIERGGSRSDRCKNHRQKHRTNIQGMAVAYIDMETVGEVVDRENPTGPLGGLGPLPGKHAVVPDTSHDLQDVNVGMTDQHIVEMVQLLREKRVLILKAGTGTGKSTFVPYRLMDPPEESLADVTPGAPFGKLTELGQIVVTEPRVQAAVGVANFVGGVMSGVGEVVSDSAGGERTEGGVGPGCPVGYQVSGDRNHDPACQLVYVTDGTMVNWLREGQLSRIGTVIVDEAHERSVNIDFIMGYLKRELDRYPHLRVIVTSATFDAAFYQEYFGGPDVANVMDVPATKSFGYGFPLFPGLDTATSNRHDVLDLWDIASLPLSEQNPRDEDAFIKEHWPEQFGPPFEAEDVRNKKDIGEREDVWDTTNKLLRLRSQEEVPVGEWRERMPGELAEAVIRLAKGLDKANVFGDILAFLPTQRTIESACEEIESAMGKRYRGHVFPLISSLPKDRQKKALAKRRKGDPRKIVVSTNLAETSLTVEGVRFIVDSGLIAQSEWDPVLAQGGVRTKQHSRAGVQQRWGRVGRKEPGWVFPLYTKSQYLEFAQDTPPGSTRENLEALVMTAKMGGIDDVIGFPWPAAFPPKTTELDEAGQEGLEDFKRELARADKALQAGGAVDEDGHPTTFGKELSRIRGMESTAGALAILYADRLACVPEVATVLSLLEDNRLVGHRGLLQDDFEWPDEWRLEAAECHRGLASLCEDDADLALLICAAWERADPNLPPWEPSDRRKDWARQWWINNETLLEAASKRQEVLASLSPAMKEEAKRFIEPGLSDRARGVISRAFAGQMYHRSADSEFTAVSSGEEGTESVTGSDIPTENHARKPITPALLNLVANLEDDALFNTVADAVIPLRRRVARDDNRISSLVTVQGWAEPEIQRDEQPTGAADAMRLVVEAAAAAPPDPSRNVALHLMESWPVGQRMKLSIGFDGEFGTIELVEKTIRPFRRPKNDEELEEEGARKRRKPGRRRPRRDRAFDDDQPEATRDDSDGEINPAMSRQGFRDEDDLSAEAFRKADQAVASSASCGVCFPCLNGNEADCEDLDRVPDGKRQDLLQSWRDKASKGIDVSTPRVLMASATGAGKFEGWYEVVGYGRDDQGKPAVRLRPDWRPEAFRGSPAQHRGVAPGDPVEVAVGSTVRHHGGELRIFVRTDGQGRFVVRDARARKVRDQAERGEIAASLHSGTWGLLAELTEGERVVATVVPARVDGCFTITLLELLHQHFSKSATASHVVDRKRRNASRTKLYPAVVELPANENGYVTAVLLHRDVKRNIRHRFDFNVVPEDFSETRDDESTKEKSGAVESPALGKGDPVLLHIVRDNAEIDVGGLDLDVLVDIEAQSDRRLKLLHAVPDDSEWATEPRGGFDVDTSDEVSAGEVGGEPARLAAPGAKLRATSDKPLSRSAAESLAGLDDAAVWQNDVWAFWARSHHLKVDWNHPYIEGTKTEPVDVRAQVRIATGSPLEERMRRVEAFGSVNPVGSIVDGSVNTIIENGVFVQLADNLEGRIDISELAWRFIAHPADVVAPGDDLRLVVVKIGLDPPKIGLSLKALQPKPYDEFKSTHAAGDVVTGTVRNVTDRHVYVDLPGDVDGVVFVRDLSYRRVERASDEVAEGEELTAEVKGFDDERDQVELSVKALRPKPYDAFKKANRVGNIVVGSVRNVTDRHVYVDLPGDVDGVVFVGELRHTHVKNASDVVGKGEELRAKIKAWDDERDQVELSVKALRQKPYDAFKKANRVGTTVTGTVGGMNRSFAYIDLPGGATGAVHISQLTTHRVNHPSDVVTEGQVVQVKIAGFDDGRSQVELSLRGSTGGTPVARRTPQPRVRRTATSPAARKPDTPIRRPKRTATGEGESIQAATAAAAKKLGLRPGQVRSRTVRDAKRTVFGRLKQTARVEVTER